MMEKVLVKKGSSKTGYVMVVGKESFPIDSLDKSGEWLKLPSNPANRQWLKLDKIVKLGEVELEYHETRVLGEKGNSGSRKSKINIEDWLVGNDLLEYQLLVRKAERAAKRAELNKQLNELNNAE